LQRDDIHGISGFAMAYKEKTSFAMAHKELSLVYTNKLNASYRVFEKPSTVDSHASMLEALALPVAGHPSGIFVNHFALDTDDASEIGLEEWIEPAMLVLNSSALLTREHQNVLDAFHLLQEDASVQVNLSYLNGSPYGI
jgi:hypothetical protein